MKSILFFCLLWGMTVNAQDTTYVTFKSNGDLDNVWRRSGVPRKVRINDSLDYICCGSVGLVIWEGHVGVKETWIPNYEALNWLAKAYQKEKTERERLQELIKILYKSPNNPLLFEWGREKIHHIPIDYPATSFIFSGSGEYEKANWPILKPDSFRLRRPGQSGAIHGTFSDPRKNKLTVWGDGGKSEIDADVVDTITWRIVGTILPPSANDTIRFDGGSEFRYIDSLAYDEKGDVIVWQVPERGQGVRITFAPDVFTFPKRKTKVIQKKKQ